MPANYAHYRFGKELLGTMPAEAKACIQRFRRMYDMGLQGPDFFYYYFPWMKTSVGSLGGKFHNQSGQEFFLHATKVATSEAARAYLYGLLGHYCLDSLAHPYIESLVAIGEAEHVALESEFDRYLMAKDKIPSPHTYDMTKRFHLTRGECMTVAEFYPGSTGGTVSFAVRSMAFFRKLLANPNRKRTLRLVNLVGSKLAQNMVPEKEVEELTLYVGELEGIWRQALENYPEMLSQLSAHMQEEAPFGDLFALSFNG